MQLKEKHIGIIIIVSIWTLVFLDNYLENSGLAVVKATSRVVLLSIAFRIMHYYYPRLEQKPSYRIHIAVGFLLVVSIMTILEVQYDIIEPHHDKDRFGNIDEEGMILRESFFSIVFSSIAVSVSMVLSWAFQVYRKSKRDQLRISKLVASNKAIELDKLKDQLNPHFLFNALSNIYSIAYLGDKETPDKIMQLSKMLRYVIYDTDVERISLEKEVDYLHNYIDFQKFKIRKEQRIEFDHSDCGPEVEVAPLLLLPLVENAFKHSQLQSEEDAWVKIKLDTLGGKINFMIANTISTNRQPEILDNEGKGLENTRQRLRLIYEDEHQLSIHRDWEEGVKVFRVHLSINN